MTGNALDYSGAGSRGLALRDTAAGPDSSGRLRMVQNSTPSEDGTEARTRLRNELDRIRRSASEPNHAEPFLPPKPVRRKTSQNARPAAEAAEPQGQAAADPQISRLAGQLILMRFKGSQPADAGPKAIRALLHSGAIAGAVFGSENIHSRAQLKELMKFLRPPAGQGRPLFAISEIGGGSDGLPVVRDFEQWPSQKDIAAKGDPEYAYSTYRSMGASLAILGFDLNFGPVLMEPGNGKNLAASFGGNPLQAGVFTKTFILGHREENVIPVPIVDGSSLSVRALKTLLISYPTIPVASAAGVNRDAFEGLLRGARFCFLTLTPGSETSGAAENFNRGCDVLVLDGGAESPASVRDRVVQAVQRKGLSRDMLSAASQRLTALRASSDASGGTASR